MSVFTLEMKLLTAIVLEEYADEVKKELLRLGLLDFIEVGTLSKEVSHRLQHDKSERDERVYDVIHQVESLYRQVNKPVPHLTKDDVQQGDSVDIPSAIKLLGAIQKTHSHLREKQKNNNQELHRYEEMARYIKEKKLHYLDFHVGKLQQLEVDTLTHRLTNNASILFPLEKKDTYLLCTFNRDRTTIEEHLEAINFREDISTYSIQEMVEITSLALTDLIDKKKRENASLIKSINDSILGHMDELEPLYKQLRLYELLGEISSHFSHTRNTTIFSGWVPVDKAPLVQKQIEYVSKNKCVIEFSSQKTMNRKDIPVSIENSPVLAPFQKIVNNYSTLEYGSVNPTIFVAISYLAMFGLMFADAGQGLVLLLLGLSGLYREKKGMREGSLLNFSLLRLMIYLGGASMVGGVLFGSYFGFALFPPLWFNYHMAVFSHGGTARDVYSILGITIYFGIIIIYMGLIINWINLIRKGEYMSLIFSKNGILGAYLFTMGVYVGQQFVSSNYTSFPSNPFILYSIGVATILLFFRVPVEHILLKKEGKGGGEGNLIIDSFMEWIVIILEIFSGYLANTLSFMRVAGLGIAHVALMSAFSEMSDLTDIFIAKLLILIAGNALVIALEGLSAGIQSLRLNYYEFFTKFFVGDGKEYNPLSLQSKSGE